MDSTRIRWGRVKTSDLVQIDRRYRLQRKLGSGSFAEIYAARDIFSGKDIAVKLELLQGAHGTLEHEFDIYKKLAGGTGIPFVHSFGVESSYNVMVMDCLGRSLEDLFVHCHFQFSVKIILLLASQLMTPMGSGSIVRIGVEVHFGVVRVHVHGEHVGV
ncbi:kinase-like protein [Phlegmacium glaucopus]|nr:kinase-like protein [Phlegmacium glaucopus]